MSDAIGQNKQTVARFYRAVNAHDPSLLDPILDQDWDIHPAGRSPGREGWEPGLYALFEAFPDIQVKIEEMIGEADFVAVRTTFTGTHLGNFLKLAPTGRGIQFVGHDVHRILGNRIVETWHVEDWLSVFAQLGSSPRF